MTLQIHKYEDRYRAAILDLSLRAWAPVFAGLQPAIPAYVYDAFYPDGWDIRQAADIESFLRDEGQSVWVACDGSAVVGWIGIRLHAEDQMGEVYILAVDPDRQREGIATALLGAAFAHMRSANLRMVMVETGDDPGHSASRAAYERNGFTRWPVARYFKEL